MKKSKARKTVRRTKAKTTARRTAGKKIHSCPSCKCSKR